MENAYEILMVPRNATEEEITRAYRNESRVHHPDRPNGSNVRFKLVYDAYEALTKYKQFYDLSGWTGVKAEKTREFKEEFIRRKAEVENEKRAIVLERMRREKRRRDQAMKRKTEAIKQNIEVENKRKMKEAKRKMDAENKRKMEEAKRKMEEAKRKMEEDKRKMEEDKRKMEEDKRKMEEDKRKMEEDKRKMEEDKRKMEEENKQKEILILTVDDEEEDRLFKIAKNNLVKKIRSLQNRKT